MYEGHDRCIGASFQHEKNSLQRAPVRLGIILALHLAIWNN